MSEENKAPALIGWLVSYSENSQGEAFEIRSGRSLISSEQLPGARNIYVLYPEISAPHAVLNASPERKVVIQDVFSAGGTFLTRSGKVRESPVLRPTELRHGDVLRFGERTKFQVCLINERSK